MIFSKGFFGALILALSIILPSQTVRADCFEYNSFGNRDAGTFYLSCEGRYGRLAYSVNEVITEEARHSFVKLITQGRGFMCFTENEHSECKTQPLGAFHTGKNVSSSKRSLEVVELASGKKIYRDQPVRIFPKTGSGARSAGCFLAEKSDKEFVLGLDPARLQNVATCLIKLEDFEK